MKILVCDFIFRTLPFWLCTLHKISLCSLILITKNWYYYKVNVPYPYTDMRNGHIMFIYIYIEHRNLETRKTLTTSQFRYETFLLPLSLKGFFDIRRERHNLSIPAFSPPPHISCDTCPRPPQASESQPSRPASSFNSTNFIQIPKILRALAVRDVTRTCWPRFPSRAIVTSLCDTFAPPAHAREHLRYCCTQVTHAPSRRVLSPTKSKGIKRNPYNAFLIRLKLNM